MIVLTVANFKGGSAKTTSAAFLAHALHERGDRVLLVDADPQGSALRWSDLADWPLPVIRLDSTRLHRELPGIVADRYDTLVVDTPPMADHAGIVRSALRASTHVLVPLAPTAVEYERLPVIRDVLDDLDEPPIVAALLTRTVPRAVATQVYREAIADDGLPVLKATVGTLQRFAQAYGDAITRASATAYGDAIDELLSMEAPS